MAWQKKLLSSLSTKLAPLAFTAPLIFSACSSNEGANPETVQERIDQTLAQLIDDTVHSSEFLQDSEEWSELMTSFSTVAELSGFAQEDDALPVPAAHDDDFDGATLADFLTQHIFTSDNYEGNGVFAVPSSLLCPEIEGEDNSECISKMDQVALKIHVETAGDGLDFDVLVGPSAASPLSFELRSDRLSVVVDIGDAKEAIEHVATVMGETADLPDTMDGVIAASILRNGPQDVSFEFAVRENVELGGNFPGVGPVQLSLAAKDPMFSLRLNGADQELTASYDVGRTTFSIPWQTIASDSLATGLFSLDWQGSSATVFLKSGANSIEVSNVGIGDGTSTINLDNETLLAVDLNANSGRRFDLSISPDANGLPLMEVTPEIDLSVDVDFSALQSAGDDVPDFLIDQTYMVQLTGSTPTLQAVDGATEGALAVLSGELRIENSTVTDPIVVSTGQCLLSDEVLDGEHGILGALTSGPCP